MKLPFKRKPIPTVRRRLTGDNRAPVYSYHARRSVVPDASGRQLFRPALPAVQAKRALRYSLRRFGAIIILIAITLSLGNMLTLSASQRVLPLDPNQRTFLRDSSVYQRSAQAYFSSSLLNRTKLTVDTEGIRAALKQQFPELADVSIKLPLVDRRPIVYIRPASSTLLLTTTQGDSYILDNQGRAMAKANGTADGSTAHLSIVKDESGAKVTVGQQALPTTTVAFVLADLLQLGHQGITVSTFVLPAGKSELDAYLDGQAYFIKFNLASNTAQQQVGTFLAVRHHLQEQGTAPSQYVDVRVDGRAYYK